MPGTPARCLQPAAMVLLARLPAAPGPASPLLRGCRERWPTGVPTLCCLLSIALCRQDDAAAADSGAGGADGGARLLRRPGHHGVWRAGQGPGLCLPGAPCAACPACSAAAAALLSCAVLLLEPGRRAAAAVPAPAGAGAAGPPAGPRAPWLSSSRMAAAAAQPPQQLQPELPRAAIHALCRRRRGMRCSSI